MYFTTIKNVRIFLESEFSITQHKLNSMCQPIRKRPFTYISNTGFLPLNSISEIFFQTSMLIFVVESKCNYPTLVEFLNINVS